MPLFIRNIHSGYQEYSDKRNSILNYEGVIMSGNDFLLICVNYHCEKDVQSFVYEVSQQQEVNLPEIIIINNNELEENNNALDCLSSKHNNVIVYHGKENRGYYGGASWALNNYLTENALPDWVIVSNPDIRFEDCFFFSNLKTLHKEFSGAVIAPSIISLRFGGDQNPYFKQKPSRMKNRFNTFVLKYLFIAYTYELAAILKRKMIKVFRINKGSEKISKDCTNIYAPFGAFIIFSNKYFKCGGTLNYGAFLFGEEIFVAETAKKLGLNILHDPQLRVIHSGHMTTKISKKRFKQQYEAAKFCREEYY